MISFRLPRSIGTAQACFNSSWALNGVKARALAVAGKDAAAAETKSPRNSRGLFSIAWRAGLAEEAVHPGGEIRGVAQGGALDEEGLAQEDLGQVLGL